MQQPIVCARHPMVSRIPQARHIRKGAIFEEISQGDRSLDEFFYTYNPSPNNLPQNRWPPLPPSAQVYKLL
jgi:hypothetical protein